MWELMAFEEPYSGMGALAIPFKVTVQAMRPQVPRDMKTPRGYVELMQVGNTYLNVICSS